VEYTSHLLRRSYREGGKVRHENLGNLSHLPIEIIDAIRAMLAGRRLVDLDDAFEITRSLPHGHVAAVLGVLRDLGLERVIGREASPERDLVVALIVQRVIGPGSKLSATRRVHQSTLATELGLGEVSEADLLSAMDWLLERQDRIERTLARRHLQGAGEGEGFVLYDLSSSYVEGRSCALATLGYSRDGVKLATIQQTNARLYRAYLLKEQLRQIYRLPAAAAERLLDRWLAWARRCRPPSFVKLARTITDQRTGILAAIHHGLSNAQIKQINTQIRLIARRAFGFHSPNPLIALAMLKLADLCPPLPP
jgi:hypothetical protein